MDGRTLEEIGLFAKSS